MSDVVPQCITCKFHPCKYFTKEEREEINISFYVCEHFEPLKQFEYIYDDKED